MQTAQEKRAAVRRMFARIARRYDLMNRLMTFGMDIPLRREVLRRLGIPGGAWVLDAGAGTGDLALEALRTCPSARLVACDLTLEMMLQGKHRPGARQVLWVAADAAALPFAAGQFQRAVSGYLLRNVPDVDAALAEQGRVLAEGGRMAALDTTPPAKGLLGPFVRLYLRVVIPLLGRWVAGDAAAYDYLPDSTRRFLDAEALAERMRRAGFQEVGFVRRLFGSMAIHWGGRQPPGE